MEDIEALEPPPPIIQFIRPEANRSGPAVFVTLPYTTKVGSGIPPTTLEVATIPIEQTARIMCLVTMVVTFSLDSLGFAIPACSVAFDLTAYRFPHMHGLIRNKILDHEGNYLIHP